jgi:recombination DNA repair RAD52 pathway protein
MKTRSSQTSTFSHLEGWQVVTGANRIFGHDSWDRQTLCSRCVWSDRQTGETAFLYSSKVRVTVRVGRNTIMREAIGAGFGRAVSAEVAHEIAFKAAEIDGTKRAMEAFGNLSKLVLPTKTQAGVARRKRSAKPKTKLFVLCRNADGKLSFQEPQAFTRAAFAKVSNMVRADDVYAFARRNRSTILQLRNMGKDMERLAVAVYLVMIARASILST